MLLDPNCKPSQDVLAYFIPPRKRERSSSDGEEEGEGGVNGGLAELPVEGLKRRRRGGVASTGQGGRKGKSNRRKGGNEKRSVAHVFRNVCIVCHVCICCVYDSQHSIHSNCYMQCRWMHVQRTCIFTV